MIARPTHICRVAASRLLRESQLNHGKTLRLNDQTSIVRPRFGTSFASIVDSMLC